MKATGHSETAEAMAAIRFLLSSAPAEARLIEDPYASAFVMGRYRRLRSLIRFPRLLGAVLDLFNPGAINYIGLRHRCFDDELAEALAAGLRTVLLLGAGFDTRALRFADWGARFIEVDHPNTQQMKREIMRSNGWHQRADTQFCAADLETTALREVLSRLPVSEPVLIIWEGVAWYLRQEAVRTSLRALSAWAPPGSTILFDAIEAGVADGSRRDRMARAQRDYCARRGEPIRWGIERDQTQRFVHACGWRADWLLDAHDVAERISARPWFSAPLPFLFFVRCTLQE